MYRSREYYMALIYHYFVWARVPRVTQKEAEDVASVANALHNLPSILFTAKWTKKLSEDTWNDLCNHTKVNGGYEFLAYADSAIKADVENGRGMLLKWVSRP